MTLFEIERQLELQQYKAVPTAHDNSAIRNIFHAIFGVENADHIWIDSNIEQNMQCWKDGLANIETQSSLLGDNYRLMRADIDLIARLLSIKIYLHRGVDITICNEASNSTNEVHLVVTSSRFVERMVPHIFLEEQKQFIRSLLEWQQTRHDASVDVDNKPYYSIIDSKPIESSITNMHIILGIAIASIKKDNFAVAKYYLAQLYTEHSQFSDMLLQQYEKSKAPEDKQAYATALVLLYPEKRESHFLLFNFSMSIDNLVLAQDCRKKTQMIPGHSSSEQDLERQFFYHRLEHAETRKDVLDFAEHYFLRYAIKEYSEREFQEDIAAMLKWLERVTKRTTKAEKWHNDLVYNLSLLHMRKNDILNAAAFAMQYPSNDMPIMAYLALCLQTDNKENSLREFIVNCGAINPKSSTLQACLDYSQGCISSGKIEQLKFFIAAAECKEDIGKFMKLHLGYYWVISSRDEIFIKKGCEQLEVASNDAVEFLNAYWLGLVLLQRKKEAEACLLKIKAFMQNQGMKCSEIEQKMQDYQGAQDKYIKHSPWQEKSCREALFMVLDIDDLSEPPNLTNFIDDEKFYQYKGVSYNLGSDKHNKHTSSSHTIEEKIKKNNRYLKACWKQGNKTTDATFNLKFAGDYKKILKIVIMTIVDSGQKDNYYVQFDEPVGWDTRMGSIEGEETNVVELYYEDVGSHIRPKANSWLENLRINPISVSKDLKVNVTKISESSIFKPSKRKTSNVASITTTPPLMVENRFNGK